MYLFCPNCQAQFAGEGHCPRCKTRLLSPSEVSDRHLPVHLPPPRPDESHPFGRLMVGLVVAFGLHLAFREMTLAALTSIGELTSVSLILGYVLRVMALIPACLLAGAGRNSSFGIGAFVGGAVAAAWLLIDYYPNIQINAMRIGLALALVPLSGLGAVIGRRVWPPAPVLDVPDSPRQSSVMSMAKASVKPKPKQAMNLVRILAACSLVCVSVVAADALRQQLSRMPSGMFQVSGAAAPRVNLEITAALLLIAGLVAGAGTGAGFRHSLVAAMLSAILVVVLVNTQPPENFTGVEYYASLVSLEENSVRPDVLLGLSVFAIVLVTGTLGGQLFPKLQKQGRRRTDMV
jgi:hypothetical protein